jgi:hypothetical protein
MASQEAHPTTLMLHWLQSSKSGEFQKLNLGKEDDI